MAVSPWRADAGRLQRFNLARDRADQLISQAERIFGAGRTESKRVDPASPEA
jgi:hypothetical protein